MEIKKCKILTVFLTCIGVYSVIVFLTTSSSHVKRVKRDSSPVAKTTLGALQGTIETSRNGRKFYAFMGIPYGKVPKRFMESVPITKKWEGVKDATKYGTECVQIGKGKEDCLFLNVYTPYLPQDTKKAKDKSKLPVLFFIHGGGFTTGSGNMFGPEYWMDEDVVLVTLNYRLGVLGFLNLGIHEAPGNQGLKDQLLALKWVHKNIQNFNGDKFKVTIFGQGTGAASVNYQILSPLTKTLKLINGGIAQSGSALCPWSLEPKPIDKAMLLAQRIKCVRTKKEEIAKCLAEKDIGEIYKAILSAEKENSNDKLTENSFIPSVEQRLLSAKSTVFLPKPPLQMLKERVIPHVPLIIGANYAEGLVFNEKMALKNINNPEEIKAEWKKVGPSLLNYESRPIAKRQEITEQIRQFYFDERSNIETNVTNLCSDGLFFYCIKRFSEIYAQKSKAYRYMFYKDGGYSISSSSKEKGNPPGPTHGDELTYQWRFNSPGIDNSLSDIPRGHALYDVSRELISTWAFFAKNGKPKSTWNSNPVNWEPVSKDPKVHPKWLHLFDETVFLDESDEFRRRMQFWQGTDMKI